MKKLNKKSNNTPVAKVLLASVILIILSGCQSLFFHPHTALLYHPATTAKQPDNFLIKTSDNETLHSWLFRSDAPDVKGTVVFMHGNGGNVSTESLGMLWFLDKGYNVFVGDYRGYGQSTGKPTINGVLNDGVDILDLLMRLPEIETSELILYGQSLGGAVATYTAANSKYADNITALILDSTFTSFSDIAQDVSSNIFFTWAFQVPIASSYKKYPSTIKLLSDVKTNNILLIHSKADKMISFSHSEELFEAAHGNKKLILTEDVPHAHNLSKSEVREDIINYLNNL